MSIFSWLGNILNLKSIVDLFISNFTAFTAKLRDKIAPELATHIEAIIAIVNTIKDYAGSPTVDFIIAVIPGTLDDAFVAWSRKLLPVIATDLGLIENGLLNLGTTPEEVVKNVIGLSGQLTASFTGMSIAQAIVTSQVVYQTMPVVMATPVTNTPETVSNDPATGLA